LLNISFEDMGLLDIDVELLVEMLKNQLGGWWTLALKKGGYWALDLKSLVENQLSCWEDIGLAVGESVGLMDGLILGFSFG
jgi:hypothetical protein